MYTDKEYRKKVVENVKDPVVKDFWTKEFAIYTDRYTQEATPAIQNKVGQFTGNPLIRNIIGQPKSSFDIRTMMDEKKILLINLSKGLVGETNMRLLGSMLTTRIFLAAMSRANISAEKLARHPSFYFYVDEFQNFANETFAEILSEARKYKLNLVIAHQYIEQMEEEVRDAVFGNVGTTVAFRVGAVRRRGAGNDVPAAVHERRPRRPRPPAGVSHAHDRRRRVATVFGGNHSADRSAVRLL
ncbi:MAG: TraM recognition domain-containing protein [Candidatus Liptonbacteria bacterium]|nr:TraM recognition domain-containing protein [Candidatus Liptonbacteria bacterium]